MAIALLLACVDSAHAQVQQLQPVTVTATRMEADPFDVPASLDRVDGSDIRNQRLQVNLSESLGVVPGLALQNRQNYAQDLQLSIRGFGARSTFGIRGIRLYVDGIPATQPDGQGQLTNIDLQSVERIEVLRGPFSALYGNSSGGVVQTFTERGGGATRIVPSFAVGSYGTLRVGLKALGSVGLKTDDDVSPRIAAGRTGDESAAIHASAASFAANPSIDYAVDASHFETRGSREHSGARRDLAHAKLTYANVDDTTVTAIVNRVDLPRADDPLGLSRAEYTRDPHAVDPTALQFDTRKTFSQSQAGVIYERVMTPDDRVRVLVYGGDRFTRQYQAIPVASQIPVTSPGGVIDLARRYVGVDLRETHRFDLGDRPLTVIGGLSVDQLFEHRRGYENFTGPASDRALGVLGALRRDEDNDVRSVDPYLQVSWVLAPAWTFDAGVRHSDVRFVSNDRYVVTTAAGSNPDDSGGVRYRATLPVAGIVFAATSAVHLYATAGKGFETPTLNELAYRPSGATGLNFALRPARSDSGEVGVKTRFTLSERSDLRFNVAAYLTGTHDEIVTLSNVGGRSTYTNAGRTRRRGIESSADLRFADDWHWTTASTLLDARYRDPFMTCNAAPCTVPNVVVPVGDRIPGVAATSAYTRLDYTPVRGMRGGIEARHAGKVYVDDANSDSAASYTTANAHVGYRWRIDRWDVDAFARVDNLTDRRYVGSVIVNEGNGRWFEPAQRRATTVGVTATVPLD